MRSVILALLNNGEQEMCKIEGFQQTRRDPKELVETYKIRFAVFPAPVIYDLKFHHSTTFDKKHNGGD